jgi:hypothetical protein
MTRTRRRPAGTTDLREIDTWACEQVSVIQGQPDTPAAAQAWQDLADQFAPLLVRAAKRRHSKVSYDDAFQAANLAVLPAALTFQPGRRSFLGHLDQRARAEVQHLGRYRHVDAESACLTPLLDMDIHVGQPVHEDEAPTIPAEAVEALAALPAVERDRLLSECGYPVAHPGAGRRRDPHHYENMIAFRRLDDARKAGRAPNAKELAAQIGTRVNHYYDWSAGRKSPVGERAERVRALAAQYAA